MSIFDPLTPDSLPSPSCSRSSPPRIISCRHSCAYLQPSRASPRGLPSLSISSESAPSLCPSTEPISIATMIPVPVSGWSLRVRPEFDRLLELIERNWTSLDLEFARVLCDMLGHHHPFACAALARSFALFADASALCKAIARHLLSCDVSSVCGVALSLSAIQVGPECACDRCGRS
jgi:hypothetical protein